MKRYCKNIDIADPKICEKAIQKCFKKKSKKDMKRADIVRCFQRYGTEENMALQMSKEIRAHRLNLPPISWEHRRDKSNGKLRLVGVEDIWQQFYDNLACIGLEDLERRIGKYQCACLKGRGSKWGKEQIELWLSEGNIRVIHQYDITKNYENTSRENVMAFLRYHIKNDALLWLIDELLKTSQKGLIIGSVLSVSLNALYISQIYHFIEDDLYRIRHHKNGEDERIQLAAHQIFFVDDFAIYCTSFKNAEMADKRIRAYAEKLGYHLHDYIRKTAVSQKTYQDMMGYRMYSDHTTMRRRNYIKTKRALRNFDRRPTLHNARKVVSFNGFIKSTNSFRFRKKYHAKRIVKRARRYVSRHDKSIIRGKT